jgi:hypothetical protein
LTSREGVPLQASTNNVNRSLRRLLRKAGMPTERRCLHPRLGRPRRLRVRDAPLGAGGVLGSGLGGPG